MTIVFISMNRYCICLPSLPAQCPTILVDYADIVRHVSNGQEVTSVTCNPGYTMQGDPSTTPPTSVDYTCVDNAWTPDKILACVPGKAPK